MLIVLHCSGIETFLKYKSTVKGQTLMHYFVNCNVLVWDNSKYTTLTQHLVTVLNKFLETEGRRPEAKTSEADSQTLTKLTTEVLEQSGVSSDTLDEEFTK